MVQIDWKMLEMLLFYWSYVRLYCSNDKPLFPCVLLEMLIKGKNVWSQNVLNMLLHEML